MKKRMRITIEVDVQTAGTNAARRKWDAHVQKAMNDAAMRFSGTIVYLATEELDMLEPHNKAILNAQA